MEFHKDFEDLCASLNARCVDYLIVGGYALAFPRRLGEYGGVPVCFLGRDAFIANKRATGRAKDLADLEALGAEDRSACRACRRLDCSVSTPAITLPRRDFLLAARPESAALVCELEEQFREGSKSARPD